MFIHQDHQRFDESSEWWPEHLAPIASELEGAMARDYLPCALLVQPCGLSRVVAYGVGAAATRYDLTQSLDQWIRWWDAMIGEATGQGHTVVALVCVGFMGDVLTVPYLDYRNLVERRIRPDDLERATQEAIQKLQGTLGVRYWPFVKASLV